MFGLKLNDKLASHSMSGYLREAEGAGGGGSRTDGSYGGGGRDRDRGGDNRDRDKPSRDTGWGGGRQEVHGVDPGASEKDKRESGVTAGDRRQERDRSDRVHGDTSVGKGVNKVSNTYRDIINGKTTGRMANTATTLGQRPMKGYNQYGDFSAGTLNSMLSSSQMSDLADRAWAAGDYGSWLSNSLGSLGQDLGASIGQQYDSILNSPMDYAADLTRSPIGLVAGALTGPAGMTAMLGLQTIDNLMDYQQNEASLSEALGSQITDAGRYVGGTLGQLAQGVGGFVGGDTGAGGAGFGGAIGGVAGGIAGAGIGRTIGGWAGDQIGGSVGSGVGRSAGERLGSGGRDSGGYLASTGGQPGQAPASTSPEAMASQPMTPLDAQKLAINSTNAELVNTLGGMKDVAQQDLRSKVAAMNGEEGALSGATQQQQMASAPINNTGVVKSESKDTNQFGYDTGIVPSDAVQAVNRELGIQVNTDPRLADTSGWTYVTPNTVANIS